MKPSCSRKSMLELRVNKNREELVRSEESSQESELSAADAETMDHIHQAWEWWYNGGRVPFFGKAVCILCSIFVLTYSKGSAFALL